MGDAPGRPVVSAAVAAEADAAATAQAAQQKTAEHEEVRTTATAEALDDQAANDEARSKAQKPRSPRHAEAASAEIVASRGELNFH